MRVRVCVDFWMNYVVSWQEETLNCLARVLAACLDKFQKQKWQINAVNINLDLGKRCAGKWAYQICVCVCVFASGCASDDHIISASQLSIWLTLLAWDLAGQLPNCNYCSQLAGRKKDRQTDRHTARYWYSLRIRNVDCDPLITVKCITYVWVIAKCQHLRACNCHAYTLPSRTQSTWALVSVRS